VSEILKILRNETAEWHARIETVVPVLRDEFTPAGYLRLLERLYGFYAGFEPRVSSVAGLAGLLPDWPERQKLGWLSADLLWLGRQNSDLRQLPACEDLPRMDSAAMAFGALYVTEGSTLGGSIIARRLATRIGVSAGRGATFFTGHGSATAVRWKIFTLALSNMATTHNEQEIVNTAVQTFKTLWRWLSEADFKIDGAIKYDAGMSRAAEAREAVD